MAEVRRIDELTPPELAEVERVEAELDAFVTKRAEQAKDRETADELWQKSVEEYHEKRRNKAAEEWYAYHDRLLRAHENSLGSLILYHQKERARYARVLGIAEITNEAKGAVHGEE